MLETYQAVLRNNQIEWCGEAPPAASEQAVRVHVTFLGPVEPPLPSPDQGRRMAEALEQLARAGGLAGIHDPMAWQREVREDRPLPGRDD